MYKIYILLLISIFFYTCVCIFFFFFYIFPQWNSEVFHRNSKLTKTLQFEYKTESMPAQNGIDNYKSHPLVTTMLITYFTQWVLFEEFGDEPILPSLC